MKVGSKNIKNTIIPYIFIAPNMILFLVFVILPLIYNLYISGTDWNIISTPTWVGLQNYITIFHDPVFYKSLLVTFTLIILTVPIGLFGSLLLAVLLNNKIKGLPFFRSVLYMPAIISSVVVGMLFMWMFNSEYGIINGWLNALGKDSVLWFNNKMLAIIPVALASIWMKLGYNMVIYLAAIQSISPSYYEAAQIDGASRFKMFCYITFPLLKKTHIFLLITSIINTFRAFDIIYVMTGGGPQNSTTTIVLYIYRKAFEVGKMGEASAIGIVLFILIAGITLVQLFLTREKEA